MMSGLRAIFRSREKSQVAIAQETKRNRQNEINAGSEVLQRSLLLTLQARGGFEPPSLDSKSRVLTVTPSGRGTTDVGRA